jgi:hypothetical protein
LVNLADDPSRVVAKRANEALQLVTSKSTATPRQDLDKAAEDSRKSPPPQRDEDDESVRAPDTDDEATETSADGEAAAPSSEEGDETKSDEPPRKATRATRPRTRPRPRTAGRGKAVGSRATKAAKTEKDDEVKSSSQGGGALGALPRGIMLHAAVDLGLAIMLGGLGLFLLLTEGAPTDEVLLPFFIIFILVPGVFLAGGLGLLLGRAWGRHVNGCILHVMCVPVLAPLCLSYLVTKESLKYLGLSDAEFPSKAYYGATGAAFVLGFLLLAMAGAF